MNINKAIYNEIKKYKVIYIARHIGPDPDAFGSQMALKDSILLTFTNKKVYALGASVSRFKYFGKIDKVTEYDYDNSLLIAVDVPDSKRVDVEGFDKFKNVLKIDHHPLVDKFGNVELIDELASSTCELIALLLSETKLKLTKEIAEKLYMGIVSDSIRFLVSTTPRTLEVSEKLIRNYKLDITKLYKLLYAKPLNEVRLMGHIASTLKVNKSGFAYIEIDNDIIKSLGADSSSVSNMINDFNNIEEILVWMFISHDDKNNLYKINIRSRGPYINEIAAKYHGGGHKLASGVRTENKEDVANLIKDLDRLCIEYKEKENKNGNN